MKTKYFLIPLILLLPIWCYSQGNFEEINRNGKEWAIGGWDPVSYFQDTPQKGLESLSLEYKNSVFLFSSIENRQKFKENPGQYLPQYGGYCAWAMKDGDLAKIDPKAYIIFQGKLYLNYSPSINRKFQRDMENYILLADKEWLEFTTQPAE